ncbi:MAG: hypothetical protein DMG91_13510 [Acidobacteria bacterium]|nr:MAG: hypothetical protein DMG91_13510 [Acidobacteriota bacterium]
MQLGIFVVARQQSAILYFGLGIFLSQDVNVGYIALHPGIIGRHLESALQFGDCGVQLSIRSQHAAQLQMCSRIIGPQGNQLPQTFFRIPVAMPAHIDVRQSGQSVGGRGIECQGLLVLLLGVGEMILFFEQRTGCEMRFRILGRQLGRPEKRRDCLVRIAGCDYLTQ